MAGGARARAVAAALVAAATAAAAQTGPVVQAASPSREAASSQGASPALRSMEPVVVGDAIPQPLTAVPGDAARGRAIVANRQVGLCLLCHTGPFPEERFQGNLAPDLAGAGARWSAAQLRLRIVDSRRLNPASLMPAYHRVDGLVRVGRAWAGRPVLDAQQVEDVVAFLATLREPGAAR